MKIQSFMQVTAVAQPQGKRPSAGTSPLARSAPRLPGNQYEADQLEARLRKQYQCQQAKKAVCNVLGFGLGMACTKTFGALGAVGFLAAHVATVKAAEQRLIKDVTREVDKIDD